MSSSQRILGLSVNCVTMDEAIRCCLAMIGDGRRPRIISTVNAAVLVRSREDASLRRALQSSELVLADGMPVLWIARALGARSADRVTGVDLMAELLRVAGHQGLRLFFLGARTEVLDALVKKVGDEHAGAIIVGARDGYFTPEEGPAIVEQIRASRADILFVGMPSPFKEVWCHDNLERLGTPVVLPVGGAFDVLSGFIKRAPRAMQACGMEWLWRLLMDPKRKWRLYLETNPVFLALVLQASLRKVVRRFPFRSPVHVRSAPDSLVFRSPTE
jgi:N-acetylglucosaminyldiphosphoundecaprenol N-acetyl-beta-D-mannosaminyltransferase